MKRTVGMLLRVGLLCASGVVVAGPGSPQCSQDSNDLTPGDSGSCWNLYDPCLAEGYPSADDCLPWQSTQSCADLPNPDCGHPYFHCQYESFDTEAECREMLANCVQVPPGAACKDYLESCLLDDLGWAGCEILFGGDCLSLTAETDCEDMFFSCFQWRNPAAQCGPYLDGRSCPELVYEHAPDVYFACLRSGFDTSACAAVLASVNRAGEVASCDALAAQCLADGIAPGICDTLFADCNFTPPGDAGSAG